MTTEVFEVLGMTCAHCVAAVTNEIAAIPGVVSVRVDLRPGASSDVVVDADTSLDRAAVSAAVDEAGYELAG